MKHFAPTEIHVQVSTHHPAYEKELYSLIGGFDSGSGFGVRDLYIPLNGRRSADVYRVVASTAKKYHIMVQMDDGSDYSGEF